MPSGPPPVPEDLTPQQAAVAGLGVSACPYKPGTPEANAWARQWVTATNLRLSLAGGFGATPRNKTDAGLPALPTRRGAVFDRAAFTTTWTPPSITLNAAMVANLNEAVRRFGCHMATLYETIQPVVADLARYAAAAGFEPPDTRDPKTRALDRKRRPTVCHRHGATPGGFCRACTRQTVKRK